MCAASLMEKVLFNRQVEVDSLHPTRAGKTRAAVQYGEVVVEHEVAWFEQEIELVRGLYDNFTVLHGRTSFTGPRWMKGIYFDLAIE
jgi:hypothetical protein